MMLLDPSGKVLFLELCIQLNRLKLEINEKEFYKTGKLESVPFNYRPEIQQKGDAKTLMGQVATVQYNGGEKVLLKNRTTGVTLRFYLKRFEAFGLDSVLEKHTDLRSAKKGPSTSQYYDYIYDKPLIDVSTSIQALFDDLENEFHRAFGPTQDSLEAEVLSDSIKELPKYINYTNR